jgi:glucosamine-6-phosphate deaminase
MGELLTRHRGNAYELNIAVFNRLQHTITGWPGGKPDADDTNRPERARPHPKTVLVLSPEPEDEVLSMAGTLERLHEQGHRVTVAYLTSASLRVGDAAATNFARILLEQAAAVGAGWREQEDYARQLLGQIEGKGPFGEHPYELRALKALIRRGEARDACAALGLSSAQLRFLDLPFYEHGRYRRFELADDDIRILAALLSECRPHQIYATGHLADPSSVQGLAFAALRQALARIGDAPWLEHCSFWLYRGHQKALAPHEIDMAVPMSPDQLERKVAAIQKFQTHTSPDNHDGSENRTIAQRYDALGMAEYEAIEAFERWRP